MKTQKRLSAVSLLLLGALLLFAAPVAAQANVTLISGTTSCVTTAPGTWAFPDGNIHIRGMTLQCRDESTNPRGTGNVAVIMNANWDSNMLGPIWGTYRSLTDEGGVWDGAWEGMVTTSGFQYHVTGTGQGMYEGMKIWQDYVNGVYQGRILNSNGH